MFKLEKQTETLKTIEKFNEKLQDKDLKKKKMLFFLKCPLKFF